MRRDTVDAATVEVYAARLQRRDVGDQIEQRRFPCAVRPDKSSYRPALHFKGAVVNRNYSAERAVGILHFQYRLWHGKLSVSLRRLFVTSAA